MSKELNKTYDPKDIEDRLYKKWEDNGYFHAEVDRSKKPFTIVMPPPNITGQLHMGHALDNTMQDILIRYKRMQGYNALWQPGTDHASIATEVKVIQALKEQGINKADLTREEFLEKCWDWRKEYGGRIVKQLRKLGSSADWQRERFTMDEGCSHAVQEVFTKLYKKGWIYKGSRIVNWCPVCKTSISDAEVEHEEQDGFFWHINYPVVGEEGRFVEIATTRPETLFGDTAVAVNPDDERYQDIIGKTLKLPCTDREIPVIADSYVDKEFGTGCVKITPAHDPNDFEVGKRHSLEEIVVINDDATMNEKAGKYAGMDRYECRKALVEDLKEQGLLVKVVPHSHNVGVHDRCHTTVEPMIKQQWFVKMDEMIKPAVEGVKNGEIKLLPSRMDKTYFNWTDNIRDWCISRQLWWGHRIPAWYCDDCGEMVVSIEKPGKCPKCGKEHWTQDPDTLDTWFSSALWPFSTLGWPEKTEELDYFYPTDVLVTGYDIIFFWVARMIFSAVEQTGTIPFDTVLIHGIVRDSQGRKMSKSLGNGIDPLEIIEKYGTDALRFSLILGISPGNDIRYMPEKLESASNFANKLWNASKFVLSNLPKEEVETLEKEEKTEQNSATLEKQEEVEPSCKVSAQEEKQENRISQKLTSQELPQDLCYEDKWVLAKLNQLIEEVTGNLDNFELGVATQKVYDFIWNEFCDWYIEMVKPRLYDENCTTKFAAQYTLNRVLKGALKLLHPVMPFITEEIYSKLYQNDESIMISKWAEELVPMSFEIEKQQIETLKTIIVGIRNLRTNLNVHPNKKSKLIFVTNTAKQMLEACKPMIQKLGFASEIQIQENKENIPQNAMSVLAGGMEVYLPFEDLVDVEAEKQRLQTEKERLISEVQRAEKMLSNPGFVSKAPKSKIKEEKEKLAKYQDMLAKVEERMKSL